MILSWSNFVLKFYDHFLIIKNKKLTLQIYIYI